MRSSVFEAALEKTNKRNVWEAIRACEKLTGQEFETLPEEAVTITMVEAPHALLAEEKVVFRFDGVPEDTDFEKQHVVIEIFTKRSADTPVCRVALGEVYHVYGDACYPLRARVEGVHVGVMIEVDYDSQLFRLLAGRHERAALIFQHMWRLQMGPVLLDRNRDIAGALYS